MLISSRVVAGKCPVCGANQASCGGPTEVHPLDRPEVAVSEPGPLGEYYATINGHETTVQMTRKQAAALGLKPVPKPKPQDKQGTAETK